MRNLILVLASLPLAAQLLPPISKDVTARHHTVSVKELESANRFWFALGGEPAQFGAINLIKFPALLFQFRQPEAGGVKIDGSIREAANMPLAVAVLTDPLGTFIEISQGFITLR